MVEIRRLNSEDVAIDSQFQFNTAPQKRFYRNVYDEMEEKDLTKLLQEALL